MEPAQILFLLILAGGLYLFVSERLRPLEKNFDDPNHLPL